MKNKVEIRLLGSGTILSGGDTACSSTLLLFENNKILVDCGPGSFLHLKTLGISPTQIDFIFLTHFHPDHINDLIPIIFFLANSPTEERRSLEIWGPAGIKDLFHHFRLIYGEWLKNLKLVIRELTASPIHFAAFSVDWLKVLHNRESVGYRFNFHKKIISFSGDSSYCPELVRLCWQADIAFLECSFPDENEQKGHLTPAQVARIGQEAQPEEIVITHLYPEIQLLDPLSMIKKSYAGRITLGKDFTHFSL